MLSCLLCRAAEENEIYLQFIFTSKRWTSGVVTFHNVNEMSLPENYMNLAKFIVEGEKVKRAAHGNSSLSDVEKDCNLPVTLFYTKMLKTNGLKDC